ncbi:MAG TPA: bifunctional hydroxymethylpyrimidine kinase/phosphomethylpyrimidine kinase [Candidatus Binataceae bacterium]|nr:bifunctional hydroxymethylpyrimidine kinase/phosphomethylpyrimidine kinase [Candidatus Binataceae bacterium]
MRENTDMTPVALTIAGSDSSGGAGIQADLKTFAAFGVFGTSVITALTAQNTVGVRAIANLEPEFIAAQIDAVADDMPIAAAKTGMLSRAAVVEAVAVGIRAHRIANLVVDPVMVAASGDVLLERDAIAMLRRELFPFATVITPNLQEAELLCGGSIRTVESMREAARKLVSLGVRAALVTGGALEGDAVDVLYDGAELRDFREKRVPIGRAHGAGCTLSAAIAAALARGLGLIDAITLAKKFVTRAMATAPALGKGSRPLNHLVGSFPDDPS